MRPQMKEKRGAEVNTHKTSIRSGGNLPRSLLRSASPHLGQAGNRPRRRPGIQSDPAASSSGARSLPPARPLLLLVSPRARTPAEPGPGGGEGRRTGRRCGRCRPPALHSLCMAAGRASARRAVPPLPPPKISPAAPIGCARPDVTKLLNFRSGGRVKVWGPRWPRRSGPPAPRSPFLPRPPPGRRSPRRGEPAPSPGRGFGEECGGRGTGTGAPA